MTVSDVSAENEDTVEAAFQCLCYVYRIDSARAHRAQHSNSGRVLESGYTGQVRSGVGAPITEESQDLWFKSMAH